MQTTKPETDGAALTISNALKTVLIVMVVEAAAAAALLLFAVITGGNNYTDVILTRLSSDIGMMYVYFPIVLAAFFRPQMIGVGTKKMLGGSVVLGIATTFGLLVGQAVIAAMQH